SSRPANPTTMFKPRESIVKRIAKLVMRTHAVPTAASAKGSASSATTISATPIHLVVGFLRSTDNVSMVTKIFESADARRSNADARRCSEMPDEAPYLQPRSSKIDQETDATARRLQVVDALLSMVPFEGRHGFHPDDHAILDEQVRNVVAHDLSREDSCLDHSPTHDHARSPTRSPNSPEGRKTSTRISTMNAYTSL